MSLIINFNYGKKTTLIIKRLSNKYLYEQYKYNFC